MFESEVVAKVEEDCRRYGVDSPGQEEKGVLRNTGQS